MESLQITDKSLFEVTARRIGVAVSAAASAFSLLLVGNLRLLLLTAGIQRIDIISISLDSHVASQKHFIEKTLLSAAGMVRVFAQFDTKVRSNLTEAVEHDVEGVIQRYCIGDGLTFPMSAHIVVEST